MKLTEKRLRKIIRNIINENIKIKDYQKIKQYFRGKWEPLGNTLISPGLHRKRYSSQCQDYNEENTVWSIMDKYNMNFAYITIKADKEDEIKIKIMDKNESIIFEYTRENVCHNNLDLDWIVVNDLMLTLDEYKQI